MAAHCTGSAPDQHGCTHKKAHIYQAAMLDPHTGSELDIDTIIKMVDALIEAHGSWLPEFH